MIRGPRISRRDFLIAGATLGGGLAIGVSPFAAVDAATAGGDPPEVTAWIVIRPDDTVVIRMAFIEMGQGSLTGMAQLVAEELECDWKRIAWEYPSPGANLARNRIWGDLDTGGSASIIISNETLRKAGAAARIMLVRAAANGWNVPASECTVESGVISHKVFGRTTTYGKVAAAAARLEVPKDVRLKDPKDWKLLGKPVKRVDTIGKLTGKQVYGADLRLPGMLNATIKACPVFGGRIRHVDSASAERMRGVVKVVRVGESAVAVVADTWWHAKSALDAVLIEWDAGDNANVSTASIDAMLTDGLDAQKAYVETGSGDARAAIAAAAKRVEAVYSYPFQTHACMEPRNTTALWTTDHCEAWCPTQDPELALRAAAAAANLPAEKCEVRRLALGGGLGRGLLTDEVTAAILVAKALPGTPVKLLWSREEDMTRGQYHPVMKARLTGGLDANGNLTGLLLRLSGQSINAAALPQELKDGNDRDVFRGLYAKGSYALEYGIANLTMEHAMRNTHVPPGWWRGVYINPNAIFVECFVDELAHAANKDPLAFRRQLMADHSKALAVLDAAAERGGWGDRPPAGHYRGLAHFHSSRTFVAALAEISIDTDKVKVHRVVVAIDPGIAVNPAQIERQVAGSVVFSLSALFLQECTVRDGRIEQENFDSYDSMRIAQMPIVDTIVMPSGGFWGGVGEPAVAVAAPAVLNAYFAATGKRVRSFPLKNHGIRLV